MKRRRAYSGTGRRDNDDDDADFGGLESDDDEHQDQDYAERQPARGSTADNNAVNDDDDDDDDDEVDPLDAFMADVSQQVKASHPRAVPRPEREDWDEAGPASEDYLRAAAAPVAASVDYDSDGLPVGVHDTPVGHVEPLPRVDHANIQYQTFRRVLLRRDPAPVPAAMLGSDRLRVSGDAAPAVLSSWQDAALPERLHEDLTTRFSAGPTPIQRAAIPAALCGRDVLGVAKTGSGKTLAYLLPVLVHILANGAPAPGQGPRSLVLAPTRELVHQIGAEAQRYGRCVGVRSAVMYGGVSKWEQKQDLARSSVGLVIATPGRLIDLVRTKAIPLVNVTQLVLDEADRMLALGFEAQVRSVIQATRPDRQTMMFSATMKRAADAISSAALQNPVRITIGVSGEANRDVSQRFVVLPDQRAKTHWLVQNLPDLADLGSVLIFETTKDGCHALASLLIRAGFPADSIHGDRSQGERLNAIKAFRDGRTRLLVATDVAARGLDIPGVRTVINYSNGKDGDTYTHRIGRTGRAGDKDGVAITLLLPHESRFAAQLVRVLNTINVAVPPDVERLAARYQAPRPHRGRGAPRGRGGGAGYTASRADFSKRFRPASTSHGHI